LSKNRHSHEDRPLPPRRRNPRALRRRRHARPCLGAAALAPRRHRQLAAGRPWPRRRACHRLRDRLPPREEPAPQVGGPRPEGPEEPLLIKPVASARRPTNFTRRPITRRSDSRERFDRREESRAPNATARPETENQT